VKYLIIRSIVCLLLRAAGESTNATEEGTQTGTAGETFGKLLGKRAEGERIACYKFGLKDTSKLGVVRGRSGSRERSCQSRGGGGNDREGEEDLRRVHF
jgi:hypothetical protein